MDGGQIDRALGAMMGLAVGDALGTTLEFEPRDRHPLHTEMTGGGPFHLPAGAWTDDTSMALALADSLLACGGYDPRVAMDRYVDWWRDGVYSSTGECFDIGNTTRSALDMYVQVLRPEVGSRAPDMAGNGSIMRLAPAVLFALPDVAAARSIARQQTLTTHGAAECVEACEWMGALLASLVMDTPMTLDGAFHSPGMARILHRGWTGVDRSAIRSTGYVIDTLEAALWADNNAGSFEEALVLAVNLGGDADTVGAVTGQIAGARHGLSAIPRRWLDALVGREMIEAVALRLVEATPTRRPGLISRIFG